MENLFEGKMFIYFPCVENVSQNLNAMGWNSKQVTHKNVLVERAVNIANCDCNQCFLAVTTSYEELTTLGYLVHYIRMFDKIDMREPSQNADGWLRINDICSDGGTW